MNTIVIPKPGPHWHLLNRNAVIGINDQCWSRLTHDWHQCSANQVNKPVGTQVVIRRDHGEISK